MISSKDGWMLAGRKKAHKEQMSSVMKRLAELPAIAVKTTGSHSSLGRLIADPGGSTMAGTACRFNHSRADGGSRRMISAMVR